MIFRFPFSVFNIFIFMKLTILGCYAADAKIFEQSHNPSTGNKEPFVFNRCGEGTQVPIAKE